MNLKMEKSKIDTSNSSALKDPYSILRDIDLDISDINLSISDIGGAKVVEQKLLIKEIKNDPIETNLPNDPIETNITSLLNNSLTTSITSVPNEISNMIIQYLNINDLLSYVLCCQKTKSLVINNEKHWQHLFGNKYLEFGIASVIDSKPSAVIRMDSKSSSKVDSLEKLASNLSFSFSSWREACLWVKNLDRAYPWFKNSEYILYPHYNNTIYGTWADHERKKLIKKMIYTVYSKTSFIHNYSSMCENENVFASGPLDLKCGKYGFMELMECSSRSLSISDPGIYIPELDLMLTLPLKHKDLTSIINSIATRAPMGKGIENVTDFNKRKCWQLNTSQFVLTNPKWNELMTSNNNDNSPLRIVYESMISNRYDPMFKGKTYVVASLYKLLIYQEGDFFKSHVDTQRSPTMFGTLSISLPVGLSDGGVYNLSSTRGVRDTEDIKDDPRDTKCKGKSMNDSRDTKGKLMDNPRDSKCKGDIKSGKKKNQGGELIINNKDKIHKFKCASKFPLWVAFFTDCEHEIKPVTSGFRVSLIYNLFNIGGKFTTSITTSITPNSSDDKHENTMKKYKDEKNNTQRINDLSFASFIASYLRIINGCCNESSSVLKNDSGSENKEALDENNSLILTEMNCDPIGLASFDPIGLSPPDHVGLAPPDHVGLAPPDHRSEPVKPLELNSKTKIIKRYDYKQDKRIAWFLSHKYSKKSLGYKSLKGCDAYLYNNLYKLLHKHNIRIILRNVVIHKYKEDNENAKVCWLGDENNDEFNGALNSEFMWMNKYVLSNMKYDHMGSYDSGNEGALPGYLYYRAILILSHENDDRSFDREGDE